MPTLRRVPIALAIVLTAAPAWPQTQFGIEDLMKAAQNDPKKYYTIDESTVRIEKIKPLPGPGRIKPPNIGDGEGGGLPGVDEIINIGLKIWKIIVDNKPVVDVKTQYATALPKGASGWTDTEGWHVPVGEIYALTAKNGYGFQVINVRYQVLRTYGGSYHLKGKYLTAVTVEPLLVEVLWGYHFMMEASVPDSSIVNRGTSADPIAGMTATLHWVISTPIKHSEGKSLYFLQGDGAYKEIGGPFADPSLDKAKAKLASAAAVPRLE